GQGLWPSHIKDNGINPVPGVSHEVSQTVDYDGVAYVAEVTIGTPEQKFRVIMDTGSANFFIPDVSCQGIRPKACESSKCDAGLVCKVFCSDQRCCRKSIGKACSENNSFNATASTSYMKTEGKWNVQYSPLSAEGFLGNDTVRLRCDRLRAACRPWNNFSVKQQSSRLHLETTNIDGILGLAFPAIASSRIHPTVEPRYPTSLTGPTPIHRLSWSS
ncbi:hypothetical protein OSTOST_08951, partial [Ostertagia ostertagi]